MKKAVEKKATKRSRRRKKKRAKKKKEVKCGKTRRSTIPNLG